MYIMLSYKIRVLFASVNIKNMLLWYMRNNLLPSSIIRLRRKFTNTTNFHIYIMYGYIGRTFRYSICA